MKLQIDINMKKINKCTKRETESWPKRQTNEQIDRLTNNKTERQTDRQKCSFKETSSS